MISVAGVHGGSGATTATLLLAHALDSTPSAPTLAVDLAGVTQGGLALLGGASTDAPAESIAAAASWYQSTYVEPFRLNPDGVRILGTLPAAIEERARSYETFAARIAAAIDSGVDDADVGAIARHAANDALIWGAISWGEDDLLTALGQVLDGATTHHRLVALDVGLLASDSLERLIAPRSDLHLWIVPGRADSFELAAQRLPSLPVELRGTELIAVWDNDGWSPSARMLSTLGDARGAPVVRLPNFGSPDVPWRSRAEICRPGLDEILRLAHRARRPRSPVA